MKNPFKLIAALLAACFIATAAFAAEASPTGTWKWMVQGRQGGQGFEQVLKLALTEGKLTGTMMGAQRGQFSVPDTEISDASYKDGTVKFSLVREFNGNKFTTHYEGKLNGDTIKGTSEITGIPDREPMKRDWEAKRVK